MDALVNIEVYAASGKMLKEFDKATNLQQIDEHKIGFTYRNKQVAINYPVGIIVVTEM